MGVPWHPQEPRHLESDVSRWWWDGIGPVNSEAKKTSCITVKSVYWCSSDFAVAMSLHRLLIQSALFHLLWRSLYFYFKDLNHLISMLTCFHHAHAYPVPLGGTLTHETTAARPPGPWAGLWVPVRMKCLWVALFLYSHQHQDAIPYLPASPSLTNVNWAPTLCQVLW